MELGGTLVYLKEILEVHHEASRIVWSMAGR